MALCNFGKKGLGVVRERLGVRFFVGIEVAAEGGVFDLQVVVALLQFLDRGDHRRDERRVFEREGFIGAAMGHEFWINQIDLLRDEAHVLYAGLFPCEGDGAQRCDFIERIVRCRAARCLSSDFCRMTL